LALTLLLQLELDGVLSKENSASRRMMDVEIVMESLRNRVVELQVQRSSRWRQSAGLHICYVHIQTLVSGS
jgi:hypothetical protein